MEIEHTVGFLMVMSLHICSRVEYVEFVVFNVTSIKTGVLFSYTNIMQYFESFIFVN